MAIGGQFAALIRNLAEFFRLEHAMGRAFSPSVAEPYILGALVTALALAVGVPCLVTGRNHATTAIAVANVVGLLVLKGLTMR
jgi:Ca2+/H+ antiporter